MVYQTIYGNIQLRKGVIIMKSYKVTTCEPYTDLREKTFTDKKKMLEYLKEHEAEVVKLEEVATKKCIR